MVGLCVGDEVEGKKLVVPYGKSYQTSAAAGEMRLRGWRSQRKLDETSSMINSTSHAVWIVGVNMEVVMSEVHGC